LRANERRIIYPSHPEKGKYLNARVQRRRDAK
jgi:hypothetical protein